MLEPPEKSYNAGDMFVFESAGSMKEVVDQPIPQLARKQLFSDVLWSGKAT